MSGTNIKNWDDEYAMTDEEKVDNRPNNVKVKPKMRKWKLQARSSRIERGNNNGPINSKRPNSELAWPSPKNKKKRVLAYQRHHFNYNYFSPSQAKLQLKLTNQSKMKLWVQQQWWKM